MKAFLMHRDRDFDLARPLPPDADGIARDLGLAPLLDAMAQDDTVVGDVARQAMFQGLADLDAIAYRQDILRDCLANRDTVRRLHALAVEAIDREHKNYFGLISRYPGGILHRSVDVLEMFVEVLLRLRKLADAQAERFHSEGFRTFFAMLQRELDDAWFAEVRRHLAQLKFRSGTLISAGLGAANKGVDDILRQPRPDEPGWFATLLGQGPPSFSFKLHERDEAGARALSELNDRGINLVANASAQANDHILSFFRMVRAELAFYIGCLNLEERLAARGDPICLPEPAALGERVLAFTALYDVALALSTQEPVTGNDGDLSGKDIVIVTGANQGGKSTFLRSLGLAQTMMQAGMFTGARRFAADLCCGLHTHCKREEDASMTSGKFDEELARMSAVVDRLSAGGMVLFNESFQSTNEREGSAIAREIVLTLIRHRIKVVFVTHLYDFARSLHARGDPRMAFLRAERRADGVRSFHIVDGAPLSTSFGEDLYRQIFTAAAAPAAAAAS